MSLIDKVKNINRSLPKRVYYCLYINNIALGFVDMQILSELDTKIFTISPAIKRIDIFFKSQNRQAFEEQIELFFRNYFTDHQLNIWRDEYYAVTAQFGQQQLFLLERAAFPFLGLTSYGVHVNGYVKNHNGLYMWIAKRSINKNYAPGKLDQIAAGGQPYDLSLRDNMIKECREEASIPEKLSRKAKPVSSISYCYDLPIGIRNDVIFNYDLCLPNDFIPNIYDDEVDSFHLYSIPDLLDIIANTNKFKLNSAVVIIDFAMRHGFIDPDNSDYLALQEGMHQRQKRLLTDLQIN